MRSSNLYLPLSVTKTHFSAARSEFTRKLYTRNRVESGPARLARIEAMEVFSAEKVRLVKAMTRGG
jgi:hypothetical protein